MYCTVPRLIVWTERGSFTNYVELSLYVASVTRADHPYPSVYCRCLNRNVCTISCAGIVVLWTQGGVIIRRECGGAEGGAAGGHSYARTSRTRRPAAPYTIWSPPNSVRMVRRTFCSLVTGSLRLVSVNSENGNLVRSLSNAKEGLSKSNRRLLLTRLITGNYNC